MREALGHHVVLEKELRSQVRSTDSVECGMTEQDQLPPKRQPELADPDAEIAGVPDKHLLDLWQWAYSDLVSNDIRGVVAEYLVGSALGCLTIFGRGLVDVCVIPEEAGRVKWGMTWRFACGWFLAGRG